MIISDMSWTFRRVGVEKRAKDEVESAAESDEDAAVEIVQTSMARAGEDPNLRYTSGAA